MQAYFSSIRAMTHPPTLLGDVHWFHLSAAPPTQAGNLWDYTQQRQKEEGRGLAPREALAIFIQLCAALQLMHLQDPPLVHFDVKPHNVLLRLRSGSSRMAAPPSNCWNGGGRDSGHLQGDAEQLAAQQQVLQQRMGKHEVVLIDFGSTRPARRQVANRLEAITLQEEAEVRGLPACLVALVWTRCQHLCLVVAHLVACLLHGSSGTVLRRTARLSSGMCPPPALLMSAWMCGLWVASCTT
jgi:serine/threonine protein kinase